MALVDVVPVPVLVLLALAVGLGLGFFAARVMTRARGASPPPLKPRRDARSSASGAARVAARAFSPTDLERPKRLLDLSGSEFERAAAEAFRRAGYEVEERGGIGDRGVDLVVAKADARAIVQVRHRSSGKPVDVHPLRELLGVLHDEKVPRAAFVSSSGFTPEARAFAHKHALWIITLNGLKELSRGGRASRPREWDEPTTSESSRRGP